LNPSLPFGSNVSSISAIPSSPFWIYPAWVAGSVLIGVLFGIAIKDIQLPAEIVAKPGIVAKINDPQYATADSSLKVAQIQTQSIQGNASSLQGASSDLQAGQSIVSLQNGFSGYGQQGSVGTSAAMQ
jgi:hypothetical protein